MVKNKIKKKSPKSRPQSQKILHTIGFIGAGNMAEALIRGLLSSQILLPKQILASDPQKQRLQYVKQKYKIQTISTNLELLKKAQVIILAVKPQNMIDLSKEIKKGLDKRHLLISILAGISTQRLRDLLGKPSRIIRVMPNSPVLIGCGASALFKTKSASLRDLELAKKIFQAVGLVTLVKEEDLMHPITGLSGSGPAYVFYFLEGLIQGGIQNGLDEKTAKELSLQTVIGSAQLVRETGEDPKELRKKVSSPGGTTLEGIKTLEEGFFLQNIERTIDAATNRSRELALLF